MTNIAQFFEDLKGKKVAFIGIGVSHRQVIKMLLKKGIDICICDRKSREELGDDYINFCNLGAEFSLGEEYLNSIWGADIIFRTPGMYYNHPALIKARQMGKIITSEMEIFFELCPCKIYAVTGSDGKTTTTSIIAKLFESEGKTVHLGGNIGRALLPIIEEINEEDVAVVELSSFQLISMTTSPDVAVITNISPNHLDVHGTMEEYIDAKKNLILHQGQNSKAVLNLDNELSRQFVPLVRGELIEFSRREIPEKGAFLGSDGYIYFSNHDNATRLFKSEHIRIPGEHNIENFLAAISAVQGEVSEQNMHMVALEFRGVEHRIEFVREKDGVKWYNDSIATSPTRTIAGLNAFNQKLIIIAGGYDKEIPFEPLAPIVNRRVKALILMGQTADKIEKAVRSEVNYDNKSIQIRHADNMEGAVAIANEIARSGDIVSLSPASASFDKYDNFEQRGQHYKDIVNSL
ncbi:MAG: UDP-N-acetylmuramoyl-L-alanine--D-glutamate ligase [Clostridiales bacterium]|nr:UDP-N-acetylmuramoyl-L-alanine--D-glutamate ligase [Clostridiales bacterium]